MSLSDLHQQHCNLVKELSIFLVDDASSDGTSDAVAYKYPDVTIIPGGGNLYWAGFSLLTVHVLTEATGTALSEVYTEMG